MTRLDQFIPTLVFLLFRFVQTYGQYSGRVDVSTTRGPLFGLHFDQGNDTTQLFYGQADVFFGIPFAVPPTGILRFAKPQSITKFPGASPYNATYSAKECVQGKSYDPTQMSEDCLYLNIISPNANSATKYPVLIWIHGGGLKVGNAGLDIPGAVRNLVSRGVVLASIQYRLGFLGFFSTFTNDFTSNLGMLDQVEALKFIKEEISNFGGDPNRITIAGQSAGSVSVSAHTYSPLSQNLFQQAIQESGAILSCFEDSLGPTHQNARFAQLACNFTEDMWNRKNFTFLKDCLMNIDLAVGLIAESLSSAANTVCWDIVPDNYFFPDLPQNLWQKRPNIPRIIGVNKDEWASVEIKFHGANSNDYRNYTKTSVEKRLAWDFANLFGNKSQIWLEMFENIYLKHGTADDDWLAWLNFMEGITTAAFFTAPSATDIVYYLRNKNTNVYTYEFTYSSYLDLDMNVGSNLPPNYHPVIHGAELFYVFMPSSAWLLAQKEGNMNATDLALANFFGEAWTNFVKTGKPTTTIGDWQPTISLDATRMEYFDIGQNSTMRQGFRALDQITFNKASLILTGGLPQKVTSYKRTI